MPLHLAQSIDHTLLKPDATEDQILNLCLEGKKYSFYSVCIHPCWLPLATQALKDTPVRPITVVGFPLGSTFSTIKAEETRSAIAAGAKEIDMVINIGAAKSENWDIVEQDIQEVISAAKSIPVKVILETCYLIPQQIVQSAKLAKLCGAAFVKTSTGFGSAGATIENIKLLRQTVGPDMGVKASGGIRTYSDFIQMIEAGANRIGTSNSVNILSSIKHANPE